MKSVFFALLLFLGLFVYPFSDAQAGKEEDMMDEISNQVAAGNCNSDLGDSFNFMAGAARDARDINDSESQTSFWEALSASISGACGSAELNSAGCSALQAKL